MAQIQEISLNPPEQGLGTALALTADTPDVYECEQAGYYVVSVVGAACFFCRGDATTEAAVDDDQYLMNGQQYRVGPMLAGEHLCFVSASNMTVYISPGV